jgi:hypothetical protein
MDGVLHRLVHFNLSLGKIDTVQQWRSQLQVIGGVVPLLASSSSSSSLFFFLLSLKNGGEVQWGLHGNNSGRGAWDPPAPALPPPLPCRAGGSTFVTSFHATNRTNCLRSSPGSYGKSGTPGYSGAWRRNRRLCSFPSSLKGTTGSQPEPNT